MTTTTTTAPDVGAAFTAAARRELTQSLELIEHCLAQLPEDDLHWRPFETQNSLCNIVLHLCGNVRQWIISGVGRAPDVRDRAAEFADRTRIPRADLLARLRATVEEADAVLAGATADDLVATRRIQGNDVVLSYAILHTVAHFEGHAQEITYVTRLRLGERYRFRS